MTDERLMETLRRLLALADIEKSHTTEAEAQVAAATIQKLLTQHNLSMADLEQRGQEKPGIREESHDLGKAAFKWKLELAKVVAKHYFCYPMVDDHKKTVAFVGRPENVEALQMLYAWIINQIRALATDARRQHIDSTGEHIDPLRWQISFGEGAVGRLRVRLADLRRKMEEESSATTALVLHHDAEISDYFEETYGYRVDGQSTKEQRERRERYEKAEAERQRMKIEDPQAYYVMYPWDRPLTAEQKAAHDAAQAKADAEWLKKQARNARRRTGPAYREQRWTAEDQRKENQSYTAQSAGRQAADSVNLQPFLKGGQDSKKPQIGG